MSTEAPLAFSRLGTSYEQSSQYQGVHADLWSQSAEVLDEQPGYDSQAAAIRRTVAAARVVHTGMTAPDGDIVQVGNADLQPGQRGTLTEPRTFGGVVAQR